MGAMSNWASSATSTATPSTSSSLFFLFPGRSGSSQLPTTATRAASSSATSSSSASSSSSIENLAAAAPKRPPRFFVEPEQLSAAAAAASSSSSSNGGGAVVLLPPSEARHARKVLRLRPGAPLELCDGRGRIARAVLLDHNQQQQQETISKSDPGAAAAMIEGPVSVAPVPLPRLSLAVAALGLKGGRGDWLVEKAAELGAASLVRERGGGGGLRKKKKSWQTEREKKTTFFHPFESLLNKKQQVPLATERSPVSDRDVEEESEEGEAASDRRSRRRRSSSSSPSSSTSSRSSRWRRLAEAAGKQCLRPHALEIERAASVEELADRIRRASSSSPSSSSSTSSPSSSCLALVAAEGAPPVAEVLLRERGEKDKEKKVELVFLIVGPEGDFTPRELEVLLGAGARPVGLGGNRLRVETAAEALLAVAGAMLG